MKEVNIDGTGPALAEGEKVLSGPQFVEVLKCVLEKGASLKFTAKGYSMTPFIKWGDLITVSPLKKGDIPIGTVVAFVSPANNSMVVHRVISREKEGYVIKGDNVSVVDGCFGREKIIGRVKRVEHKSIAVPFGLGPERRLIAFLNRTTAIIPITMAAWRNMRNLLTRRNPYF